MYLASPRIATARVHGLDWYLASARGAALGGGVGPEGVDAHAQVYVAAGGVGVSAVVPATPFRNDYAERRL